MPESSLARQRFAQRKPYFIASSFGLALIVFAVGFFFSNVASKKKETVEELVQKLKPLKNSETQLQRAQENVRKAETQADAQLAWLERRVYWGKVLAELKKAFRETEEKAAEILQSPAVEAGLWIDSFAPALGEAIAMDGVAPREEEAAADPSAAPSGKSRKGRGGQGGGGGGAGPTLGTILLSCRGVNLNQSVKPSANFELASALAQTLAANTNFFGTNTTLSGRLEVDDKAATNAGFFFTFELTLKLAKPLEL